MFVIPSIIYAQTGKADTLAANDCPQASTCLESSLLFDDRSPVALDHSQRSQRALYIHSPPCCWLASPFSHSTSVEMRVRLSRSRTPFGLPSFHPCSSLLTTLSSSQSARCPARFLQSASCDGSGEQMPAPPRVVLGFAKARYGTSHLVHILHVLTMSICS
jgi:hypothetical protein